LLLAIRSHHTLAQRVRQKTGPVGAVAVDAAKKSIIRVQPITKDRFAMFDRRYGRTTRGLVGTMSR
jgi:hypothetical protein